MGFWSSLLEGISSFFSSALSLTSSLALPEVFIGIQLVQALLNILGITETKEDELELGDKAIQAEEKGITPEQFDDFDEYLEAIENFELDPERSMEIDDAEKRRRYLAVRGTQIAEKLGEPYVLPFVLELGPKFSKDFALDKKIGDYVKEFKDDFKTLYGFFRNELSFDESAKVEEKIVEIEKKYSPDETENEIINKLDAERERINKV